MAPKSAATNAAKLASILSYFHKSGVAHSIKDLEKALPSVASINSMQVKDYLNALTDENKVQVEKIGSGNWYWAFAGEEKRVAELEKEKAVQARDEVKREVEDLRDKIGEIELKRAMEETDEDETMSSLIDDLTVEVKALEQELEQYNDSDPVELETKRQSVLQLKAAAEKWTEQILSLEGYLKKSLGMDKAQLDSIKRQFYGDEYDEEEGGLKEL